MVKLGHVANKNANLVTLRDKEYKMKGDFRGAREKFWCEEKGEPSVLFKSTFSYEHYGEVIYSELADQVDMPCVKYHLAEFTDEEGIKHEGTVCESYLKDDEKTFSGYLITKYYQQLYYENNKGVFPTAHLHTVDEYVKMLHGLNDVENQWLSEDKKDVASFRNTLIKQALFDFVLAQSDRHWSNIEFIKNTKQPAQSLRTPPAFDNGGCLFLNRNYKAINTYVSDFDIHGYQAPSISARLKSYCPMLGIKTSLVSVDKGVPKTVVTNKEHEKEAFVDELTEEILHNPEIATFYILMKDKLSVSAARQRLHERGEELPENVYRMAEIVSNHQVSLLDKTLASKLENLQVGDARNLPYYKQYGYLGEEYGNSFDDR